MAYTYDEQADRAILTRGSVYYGVIFETLNEIEDELLIVAQLSRKRTVLRIDITDSELVARLSVLYSVFQHIQACEEANI